ncbi:MAG: hypothetical protein CMP05_01480 [Xanthomarina sp.]|uniref:hypothetical protein n=1 Tax=Xanthomarina sp. TaxID=1931211 RepID=UPI000C434FF2|nr:hypothetical protein [Xanthomarina sp.]MAL23205.1 hypothetical protein [Xanthomarina sp.]MBF60650.1 hypothetical protein [Xanthomarina sp.]|tara:strand:+ start:274 stop:474 length:201 start_codon:yes stop_codon:yes gene_type:complete
MKIVQATLPNLQSLYLKMQLNWDASTGSYKEIVYEDVAYDAPEMILERIKKLDEERKILLNKLIID